MRTTRRLLLPVLVLTIALTLLLSITVQAQTFGTNWIGQYYDNAALSGDPAFSRIDQQVNFVWAASPLPGQISDDNFSVRWTTGEFLLPGTYRFYLTADDGARAIINGTVIMDFFGNSGSQQTQTADFTITAKGLRT